MTTASKTSKPPARPAAKPKKELDGATRMAKALSHPVRAKILARLNERVASPNELSQEMGEPLGNVSYHVRALLDLDCVELVKTRPRRGAVEHYYRATCRAWGDEAVWELLPASAKRGFAAEWFKESFSDVSRAIDAGGLEARSNCHISLTRLDLDERAWSELSTHMDEVLEYALALQAETATRRADGQASGDVSARMILAQYEGGPDDRAPGSAA